MAQTNMGWWGWWRPHHAPSMDHAQTCFYAPTSKFRDQDRNKWLENDSIYRRVCLVYMSFYNAALGIDGTHV